MPISPLLRPFIDMDFEPRFLFFAWVCGLNMVSSDLHSTDHALWRSMLIVQPNFAPVIIFEWTARGAVVKVDRHRGLNLKDLVISLKEGLSAKPILFPDWAKNPLGVRVMFICEIDDADIVAFDLGKMGETCGWDVLRMQN